MEVGPDQGAYAPANVGEHGGVMPRQQEGRDRGDQGGSEDWHRDAQSGMGSARRWTIAAMTTAATTPRTHPQVATMGWSATIGLTPESGRSPLSLSRKFRLKSSGVASGYVVTRKSRMLDEC